MPQKIPDPDPTQPSVTSPESSSLSFTIETFDDPETGQPTQYGRFSRHWQDEEALDVLIDKLESGQLSHKQALMQARKLEATTPYNLEIQNFMANRLWALGLQDEATEVYERAYKQALTHIPKGFKGQITWSEVDNRFFLRLAHGTLLGLMQTRFSQTHQRQCNRIDTGKANALPWLHKTFHTGDHHARHPRSRIHTDRSLPDHGSGDRAACPALA